MRIAMGERLNPGAIQGDRLSMNAPDMSPIARGIQQVGNAVGGLAEKWQADQKKMDTYNANLALERWSNDAAVTYEQNLKGSAPDGTGFMETQQKYLQDSFMKVRNTIKDPELQAKADIIFEQTKGRHQLTGMKDVEKKQTSYVLSTTGDSIKSTIDSGQIGTKEQYTDYFDNVVKPRIDGVIDDPLERKKAYAIFGQQMAGEYFRLNPGEAAPRRVGEDSGHVSDKAVALLRDFEGFRSKPYWDVNAYRLGFGSDTITREDGTVVRVDKGSTVTRADAERDLARRAGEFQNRAAGKIGVDAWSRLDANQQAVMISLAYNYGNIPDSVAAAAKGGSAEDLAKSVENLKGHNGGVNADRRQREADIIRGGTVSTSTTYAPPEMPRGGPFDYIQPDDWDRMTKAGQSAFKDSLRLGIETGQVSIGDIMSAPVDDGDKATLLSRYNEVNKELDGLASFSERLASGGFINPKSSDDRKAAGKLLDGAGGAQAIVDGDPQAVQSMYDLYDKTGIVPDNAKGAINGMLRAKDGARVMTALQFLDAFDRRNHPAFNQEFDAETSAMLQDYRSGLDYDTPQQKVERIQQSIDPANATVRKERRKEAEKISDKFDIGDVGNVFDPSYMPMTEPGFGLLPDQQSQLLADYRSEYNKAFEASGDDAAARQVANDRIRSVWGASEANGGRVMKWPPEILYGANAAVNGSFDWMRSDVETGLTVRGYVQSVEFPVFDAMGNQTGATETVSQPVPYFLVADEQTVREYQAGKSPSYLVAIIDAEGRYDFPSLGGGYEQTPSRFSFDPASARDRYNRQFRADQKTNQQDAIRQEQDMQELFKPSGNALWPQ